MCARLWERYGAAHPRVVTVEPEDSACLRESALAGRAVEVGGDASTVMDGLVVGKACANAWTILGAGAFAFMTVEDRAATDAMRQAADGVDGDPGVVLGDTGSAGWAGFLAASSDPRVKEQLGLDSDSRVVIVATEGATDPEVYRQIVGRSPEEVEGG